MQRMDKEVSRGVAKRLYAVVTWRESKACFRAWVRAWIVHLQQLLLIERSPRVFQGVAFGLNKSLGVGFEPWETESYSPGYVDSPESAEAS